MSKSLGTWYVLLRKLFLFKNKSSSFEVEDLVDTFSYNGAHFGSTLDHLVWVENVHGWVPLRDSWGTVVGHGLSDGVFETLRLTAMCSSGWEHFTVLFLKARVIGWLIPSAALSLSTNKHRSSPAPELWDSSRPGGSVKTEAAGPTRRVSALRSLEWPREFAFLASSQVMLMQPRMLHFEDHGMNMSEGLRIPPSTRQTVTVSDSG